ncbi:MAG: STAS domain-containing protein [Candidatus Hydrogenedentes bacterium]|nr:STAS domain-containing protein [Candidatus Hydrogenedentota bacterium]
MATRGGWREAGRKKVEVSRSEIGSVGVMRLSGPFVAEECAKLTEKIDACIADGTSKIVIDMKQVPFIDSAGLETLQLLVPELARRGADFRITGLNDVCRDTLVATRMMSFLHISEDAESAVRSFR